ncbi:MAG TPA: hypothetical protein VF658_09850 [Pyrinomonadaceae bacterium]|jgi:hypothetical protein
MTASNNSPALTSLTRAALVVAHPGHELLVHGWLEITRPRVFVFTDGSARSTQSRLDSTSKILDQTGARRGSIYGRLSDASAYSAIINHEFELFKRLARELAEALIEERVSTVAGDAIEGYNPMHDVCRLLINTAVRIASHATCQPIKNLAFSLFNKPIACSQTLCADCVSLQLDEAAFKRKMAAAEGYNEMKDEVYAAIDRASLDAFRTERLHPVDTDDGKSLWEKEQPFYERYGEKRVAAGHYQQVLRYKEHLAPLAEALRQYAESSFQSGRLR